MSMSSTNPSNLFGGTWERIGVGRTLVSAGGDANAVLDENNYAGRGTNTAETHWFPVGETGGESVHILTIDEMPKHSHKMKYDSIGWTAIRQSSGTNGIVENTTSSYDGQYSTEEVGNGNAHNNMPPYLAVNMWKRIA